MASTKKKKVVSTVAAVATAAALLLGGTLAWQSANQVALNEASDVINPGGRLHDDFNGENKDVYVENFIQDEDGDAIFARIRLEEYFEIVTNHGTEVEKVHTLVGTTTPTDAARSTDNTGKKPIVNIGSEKGEEYERGYRIFTFDDVSTDAETGVTTVKAAVDGDGNAWWTWTLGGQTTFMPTFNLNKDSLMADVNGKFNGAVGVITDKDGHQYDGTGDPASTIPYVEYTDGDPKTAWEVYDGDPNDIDEIETQDELKALIDEGANNRPDNIVLSDTTVEHTAKATGTATIMSMEQWKALPENEQVGPYWVYDTDGWVYWAQPILPGEATGLLLDGIQLNQVMDDTWYYAINVVAQFVTADDVGKFEGTGTGFYDAAKGSAPSGDAETLLEKIGVTSLSNGEQPGEDEPQTYDLTLNYNGTNRVSGTTKDSFKIGFDESSIPDGEGPADTTGILVYQENATGFSLRSTPVALAESQYSYAEGVLSLTDDTLTGALRVTDLSGLLYGFIDLPAGGTGDQPGDEPEIKVDGVHPYLLASPAGTALSDTGIHYYEAAAPSPAAEETWQVAAELWADGAQVTDGVTFTYKITEAYPIAAPEVVDGVQSFNDTFSFDTATGVLTTTVEKNGFDFFDFTIEVTAADDGGNVLGTETITLLRAVPISVVTINVEGSGPAAEYIFTTETTGTINSEGWLLAGFTSECPSYGNAAQMVGEPVYDFSCPCLSADFSGGLFQITHSGDECSNAGGTITLALKDKYSMIDAEYTILCPDGSDTPAAAEVDHIDMTAGGTDSYTGGTQPMLALGGGNTITLAAYDSEGNDVTADVTWSSGSANVTVNGGQVSVAADAAMTSTTEEVTITASGANGTSATYLVYLYNDAAHVFNDATTINDSAYLLFTPAVQSFGIMDDTEPMDGCVYKQGSNKTIFMTYDLGVGYTQQDITNVFANAYIAFDADPDASVEKFTYKGLCSHGGSIEVEPEIASILLIGGTEDAAYGYIPLLASDNSMTVTLAAYDEESQPIESATWFVPDEYASLVSLNTLEDGSVQVSAAADAVMEDTIMSIPVSAYVTDQAKALAYDLTMYNTNAHSYNSYILKDGYHYLQFEATNDTTLAHRCVYRIGETNADGSLNVMYLRLGDTTVNYDQSVNAYDIFLADASVAVTNDWIYYYGPCIHDATGTPEVIEFDRIELVNNFTVSMLDNNGKPVPMSKSSAGYEQRNVYLRAVHTYGGEYLGSISWDPGKFYLTSTISNYTSLYSAGELTDVIATTTITATADTGIQKSIDVYAYNQKIHPNISAYTNDEGNTYYVLSGNTTDGSYCVYKQGEYVSEVLWMSYTGSETEQVAIDAALSAAYDVFQADEHAAVDNVTLNGHCQHDGYTGVKSVQLDWTTTGSGELTSSDDGTNVVINYTPSEADYSLDHVELNIAPTSLNANGETMDGVNYSYGVSNGSDSVDGYAIEEDSGYYIHTNYGVYDINYTLAVYPATEGDSEISNGRLFVDLKTWDDMDGNLWLHAPISFTFTLNGEDSNVEGAAFERNVTINITPADITPVISSVYPAENTPVVNGDQIYLGDMDSATFYFEGTPGLTNEDVTWTLSGNHPGISVIESYSFYNAVDIQHEHGEGNECTCDKEGYTLTATINENGGYVTSEYTIYPYELSIQSVTTDSVSEDGSIYLAPGNTQTFTFNSPASITNELVDWYILASYEDGSSVQYTDGFTFEETGEKSFNLTHNCTSEDVCTHHDAAATGSAPQFYWVQAYVNGFDASADSAIIKMYAEPQTFELERVDGQSTHPSTYATLPVNTNVRLVCAEDTEALSTIAVSIADYTDDGGYEFAQLAQDRYTYDVTSRIIKFTDPTLVGKLIRIADTSDTYGKTLWVVAEDGTSPFTIDLYVNPEEYTPGSGAKINFSAVASSDQAKDYTPGIMFIELPLDDSAPYEVTHMALQYGTENLFTFTLDTTGLTESFTATAYCGGAVSQPSTITANRPAYELSLSSTASQYPVGGSLDITLNAAVTNSEGSDVTLSEGDITWTATDADGENIEFITATAPGTAILETANQTGDITVTAAYGDYSKSITITAKPNETGEPRFRVGYVGGSVIGSSYVPGSTVTVNPSAEILLYSTNNSLDWEETSGLYGEDSGYSDTSGATGSFYQVTTPAATYDVQEITVTQTVGEDEYSIKLKVEALPPTDFTRLTATIDGHTYNSSGSALTVYGPSNGEALLTAYRDDGSSVTAGLSAEVDPYGGTNVRSDSNGVYLSYGTNGASTIYLNDSSQSAFYVEYLSKARLHAPDSWNADADSGYNDVLSEYLIPSATENTFYIKKPTTQDYESVRFDFQPYYAENHVVTSVIRNGSSLQWDYEGISFTSGPAMEISPYLIEPGTYVVTYTYDEVGGETGLSDSFTFTILEW